MKISIKVKLNKMNKIVKTISDWILVFLVAMLFITSFFIPVFIIFKQDWVLIINAIYLHCWSTSNILLFKILRRDF